MRRNAGHMAMRAARMCARGSWEAGFELGGVAKGMPKATATTDGCWTTLGNGPWNGASRGFAASTSAGEDGGGASMGGNDSTLPMVDGKVWEVADAAADSNILSAGLEYALEFVHLQTGMPWWATIAATTFALRTLLFPVVIYQIKNTAKLSLARPEIEKLAEQLKMQGSSDPKTVEKYQGQIQEVWKKYDCHPIKSFGSILVQAPTFIGFFVALRHMAEKVPTFAQGGTLWFTDLSVADPTYALPVACSLTFLATVELGVADGMQGQPNQKGMKLFMRGLSVALIPLTASMPSGVLMYWCSANAFSLLQAALMKIKVLKTIAGIPDTGHLGAEKQAESLNQYIHQKTLDAPPKKTKKNKKKQT